MIRLTNHYADRVAALTMDVSRAMRKRMCEMPGHGVQPNMLQLHALIVLQEHEGILMMDFAEILKISRPTATAFAARLVRLGWAKRLRDKENRKLVKLSLTPAGRSMIATLMRQRRAFLSAMLSRLTEGDRKAFIRILETILSLLQSRDA